MPDESIRSHRHAVESLGDGEFLGYVIVQMCYLGISLIVKRWSRLGRRRP